MAGQSYRSFWGALELLATLIALFPILSRRRGLLGSITALLRPIIVGMLSSPLAG